MSRIPDEMSAVAIDPVCVRTELPLCISSTAVRTAGRDRARLARRLVLAATLALSVGMYGCATLGVKEAAPVTVPDIIRMSQQGMADYRLINRMRQSGTVYRLDAGQLVDLHRKGVSDNVLNYMQRTYLEAVRQRQELEDWGNWSEVDGWWYGGDAWGWPDAWSPYCR
jgi:hypothetical protein